MLNLLFPGAKTAAPVFIALQAVYIAFTKFPYVCAKLPQGVFYH
jgi:hypothetical protein